MRKLTVLTFIGLDGAIQPPGGPEQDSFGEFNSGGCTVPCCDEATGNGASEERS